jgi:NADH dehydrogenase
MKNGKAHIVILGAGFGGLAAAIRLAKKYGNECEVTIIDKRTEHLYSPLLYQVACGYLHDAPKGSVSKLRDGICINFNQYSEISGMNGVAFKHAEVHGVDRETKTVLLGGGEEIHYDYLLVALGSESADFGIPGVKEHSFRLKTITDALAIRRRLRTFIDKHLDGDQEQVHVVVCGGGPSGVEVAAELANFFEKLRKAEIIRHRHARITIVDAGPTILSVCDMTIRRWSEERLRGLGIEILTETEVKEVRAGSVMLAPKNANSTIQSATELEANVVIWTAGVKASSLVKGMPFAHDERGRLEVVSTLQVRGENNVFAIGDSMLLVDERTKKPVAALAQSAMKEGVMVADNIMRVVRKEQPENVHLPEHWPSVIALGGQYAVATVGAFHFRGLLAWLMRKVADLEYFMRILPLRYALHVWWKGSRTYIDSE